MKRSEDKTCDGCIWYEQCAGTPCDDYSPISCDSTITYYEEILNENAGEYGMVILQYVDYDVYGG